MIGKKKILVLTNNNPDGHRAIAKAIYSFLFENVDSKRCDICYSEVESKLGLFEDIYKFYYKYLPRVGSFFFNLDRFKLSRKIVNFFELRDLSSFRKVIDKNKPDLVISTYYLHTPCLVGLREKDKFDFKLWTVVADPWKTFSSSIVSGVDLHLVYDEVMEKRIKEMGEEYGDVLATGWWIRSQMYKKVDRKKARESLGINDGRPVIFVGGGGVATHSLTKVLPILLNINKKVAFIFNTGASNFGFDLVESYIEKLKDMGKTNVIVKNFGWIENMAEILSACDIVLGKAGPNFLFDCVACQKPFVAVTHISGQEDGNLELIKKKKLGWVREIDEGIARFLKEYLDNPFYFGNKYKSNILKEAENNKKALPMVLARVKKELF